MASAPSTERAATTTRSAPRRPPSTFFKYLLACVAMVASMHAYHAWLGYDPLAYAGLNGALVSIDSWSLVHVVYFFGLGYFYPDQLLLFMVYGAAWELIEWGLAHSPVVRSFWEERLLNSVWDLWFNLLGYRLGEMTVLVRQHQQHQQQQRWTKAPPAEPATGAAAQGAATSMRTTRQR